LTLVGHVYSEDAGLELFIASRESVELPFGNFRLLSELNTSNNDVSPHLSSDGLAVYFGTSYRYGKPTLDFYKATRPSVEDVFSNIELIEFPGYNKTGESGCFLSNDENTMYFYNSAGIWEMQNDAKYPILQIIGNDEISRNAIVNYDVHMLTSGCQNAQPVPDNETIWSVDPAGVYGEFDADGRFIPSVGAPSGQFVISAKIVYNNQLLSTSKNVSLTKESISVYVDGENGNNSNAGYTRENAFATIIRGIEACEDGDVVYVVHGVYSGAVDFKGKSITVSGIDGAAIIDGLDGFGVSFFNEEGRSSVLRNFIIQNSYIGILMAGSSPTIENVTVTGNTYGIEAYQGAEPAINNSIVWVNSEGNLFGCWARYSCIEQGSDGIGNITENPLFVDAEGGDYRLLSRRGRYHDEYELWVIDDATSPCINRGNPEINPLGEPSPNGGRINMGAYGRTEQASMGEWVLKSDINRDGKVNIADLSEIARQWLEELSWMK
jgi:hypothetical protein